MANLSFKIKGYEKLLKELRNSPDIADKWLKKAMHVNVLDVKNQAQKNTPVKTGNLKASARTKVTSSFSKGVVGTVWYVAEYAIYVHEMTWTSLNNGRHKFLESALLESIPKIKRNYKAAMKKAFREAF